MTPEQITLIQSNYAKFEAREDEVGRLFYTRLFEIDPSLKPLFKGDLTEQGRQFMKMVSIFVGGLNRFLEVDPAVQALGVRHIGYGVVPGHFESFRQALLWALERTLGPDFTPPAREAWGEFYDTLAKTMKDSAARAGAKAKAAGR